MESQQQTIQQESAADRQKLPTGGRDGKELGSKLSELQGELAMNAARANLLDTMGEFIIQRDPKSADAEALKAHIDAIAASTPLAGNAPAPTASAAAPGAAKSTAPPLPLTQSHDKSKVRDRISDLAQNVT